MSALGSLVVKLALEYAQFTSGAEEAKKRADALAKGVQDRMDGMKDSIKSTAAAVAGGLAAAFTVGAVDQLLKDVTASQAALLDLSHMAGMTVESLSSLQTVGRYVGLSAQDIAEASVSMTDALAQAKDESDGVGQALAAIGLKFEDFRRLSPDQQFEQLAKALAGYEDGAGKAAVMTQIMGEEGAKLLPFLRDLATAGDQQASVTREQAAAASQYQANLIDAQKAADAWKQELVIGMVPALNLAAQAFEGVIKEAGGLQEETRGLAADGSIQSFVEGAIRGLSYVADAANVVWRLFSYVGNSLGGLAAAAVSVAKGDFSGAFDILNARARDGLAELKGLADDTIGARFRAQMNEIKASSTQAAAAVEKKTLAVKNWGETAAAAEEKQKQAAKAAQAASRAAQQAEKEALRELEAVTAFRVRAYEEEMKAEEARLKAHQTAAARAEDAVRDARDEEEAHLRAAAAGITHAEAIAQIALARAEDAYQQALNQSADAETLLALQREIAARKELMGVLGQRAAREANEKAADQAAKDWDKTAQTIGDTLADYIMGGGKDATQYLKRLFSTLVLQPIVQYGAQSLMGALGIGKAGDAVSAVLKGGNVGSEILNNAGLIGAGYQALFGASVGASTASLGFANAIGMAGGDALGALIAGNGGWAGVSGASGAAGSAGWFGAAAPWIAGIGALLAIIPSFLNGGTPHAGAASMYSGGEITGSGREYTKRVGVTETYQKEMQAPIDALAKSIGGALDGLAEQFGGAVGYSVQVGFKSDNDDPSNGQYRVTDATGKILREWEAYQRGELGARSTGELYDRDPQKGFDQYLQSITAATIPIVQDIVPGWADDLLDQLSDSLGIADALERGDKNPWKQMTVSGEEAFAALQAMLAKIAQIDAAFDALGETMSIFSDLSDDMKTALLGAAGSIESLTAIASSYYSSVYSEEERLQAAAEKMDKVIADMGIFADRGGLSVYDKDAKAKLRQAVDELMAAGQGELAAQLMALAQSFVQIADKSAEAAETASQAADAFKRSAIDAALGNLEAAVERESELLHERVSAVQESIGALESMRSMLKSNAAALYGTVSATAQMQAVQGMLYIEDALDAVRRGASLKDYSGLSDAVTAARGGLSTGVYTSQFEKDRDALVLANQLSELEGAAGMQLSVEEQQLKALQEQIDYYARMLQTSQQLIDGIDTLIDSTLTPDAAYDILMRALRDDYEGAKVSVSTGPAVDAAKEKESNLEREIRIISDTDKPNYADKNIGDLVDEAAAKSFENIGKAFETIDTSKGGYEISSDKAYTDFLSKIIGGVADPDADFALIGKSLSDLVDSGVGQLSLDGKQLKTLSDQLSVSGRIAQGIEELSDKSLTPSSIEDMLMRIFFEEDEQVDVTGGPARDSIRGAGHAGVNPVGALSAYDDYSSRQAKVILGDRAVYEKNQSIQDAAKSYSGTGDIAGLWSAVTAAGGNQYDIQKAYGWDIDDIERVLREQGVPGFAAGGLHSGGIRLVGERGPELEVTGPARYWDASKTMQLLQGSGGDARLWALIERLIEEQRAQAGEIVRLSSRTARVLERWDGGGLPQQRQEAAV